MHQCSRLILGQSFDTWLEDIPKAHFKPQERCRHFFLAHGSAFDDEKRFFPRFFFVIHVLWTKYYIPGLSCGFPCSLALPWCLRTPKRPRVPPPTMVRFRLFVARNPCGVLLPSSGFTGNVTGIADGVTHADCTGWYVEELQGCNPQTQNHPCINSVHIRSLL